jgi:hypothetical protein
VISCDLKRGDILEFAGNRKKWSLSGVLAAILRRCSPKWSGWGWHLAIVMLRLHNEYMILEATPQGAQLRLLSSIHGDFNIHRFLSYEPHINTMLKAARTLSGARYDYLAYIWTAIYILTGGHIPRIIDRRYTCWELVYYVYDLIGCPLCQEWQYPTICDFEALTLRNHAHIGWGTT